MGYDSLCDVELVKLSQSGDTAAGDVLLRRFKGVVNKYARHYFIMGGDRDDLIQEGMIGLYRAIGEYRTGKAGNFAGFAAVCIKNQILDAVKSAARKKHSPLNTYVSMDADTPEIAGITDYHQDPEEILIRKEDLTHLEMLVQTEFSARESEILKHYLAGWSYAQIAEELGVSAKSVDNALYRIRRKVRGHGD